MTGYRIPFNRPGIVGRELAYLEAAARSGHLSGDGPFTRKCSRLLEQELGVQRALLTPSCTHALEMCALLLGIEPGDEVIVPSFAFVTTAAAFALHRARPVFVDVREETLNLDERRVREHVTPRTRAIVALHYAGIACEMDPLLEISRETGVPIVEDNAHGLFARYRGRPLGSLGALATQSFHETKNFTAGEGGALLLNDASHIARAEVIREKGTDRSRFFRGEVDRYTWVDHGSSYLPSELVAAFLYGQLEARDAVQSRRKKLWERYESALQDWAARHDVRLPHVPDDCSSSHHLFHLVLPAAEAREGLIAHLKQRGILAVFHYLPLHVSAMGRRFGGRPGDCPVTESVSDRLVRLPLYHELGDAEQDEVIEAVLAFTDF